MIHPTSDCQNTTIPNSTNIWQFCVILPKCKIGENSNICSHCYIENDVCIGNNVTVKSGVQIWDGIELEDNVFIGANVSFTNDKYPLSKNKDWTLLRTKVCRGATIGAGSTILPGIIIGEYSMIGAGSVVTKNVPAGELWLGNPAHFVRKINTHNQGHMNDYTSINKKLTGGGRLVVRPFYAANNLMFNLAA